MGNQFLQFLVTSLFYAPVVGTMAHPVVGLTVSTLLVIWHYRHQPFKRALDQMDSLYVPPEPFDPMEIIKGD